MDNSTGNEKSIISAPADNRITCSLPRNTLAETMRLLGVPAYTDGNSPAKYFVEPGRLGPGTELPKKFLFVIPQNKFFEPDTITADDSIAHFDPSTCVIAPECYLNMNLSKTFSNSNQTNLDVEFIIANNKVWQKPYHHGGPDAIAIICEQVT
jgi:hypothetical protein